MAAPTFIAEYETVWDTTSTPKTVSVTTAVGDQLAVIAGGTDTATLLNTPTGGTGLTWTARSFNSADFVGRVPVFIWTSSIATTAETFTLSVSRNATSAYWGFNCLRFSGSGGIGASSSKRSFADGPNIDIVTTQANSAVVTVISDTTSGGAARTWRTTAGALTEVTYQYVAAAGMVFYGGYHADVGAIGTKNVGISLPTSSYVIIAVEVLGTKPPPPRAFSSRRAVYRSYSY